jgi:hypothetical protein
MLPISIPLYLLFWMFFDRAKHYSYLAVFYRHKERALELSEHIRKYGGTEMLSVLETIYKEVLSLDIKKSDKTKQALKLLQEINKALPKKD